MPHTYPGSTARYSLEIVTCAIFASTLSLMRSSVQPSASAIIAIDSVNPTCLMPPSAALLKLLRRQARADFLLKRQPAIARILDAADAHTVHAPAAGRQRNRQRVHDE